MNKFNILIPLFLIAAVVDAAYYRPVRFQLTPQNPVNATAYGSLVNLTSQYYFPNTVIVTRISLPTSNLSVNFLINVSAPFEDDRQVVLINHTNIGGQTYTFYDTITPCQLYGGGAGASIVTIASSVVVVSGSFNTPISVNQSLISEMGELILNNAVSVQDAAIGDAPLYYYLNVPTPQVQTREGLTNVTFNFPGSTNLDSPLGIMLLSHYPCSTTVYNGSVPVDLALQSNYSILLPEGSYYLYIGARKSTMVQPTSRFYIQATGEPYDVIPTTTTGGSTPPKHNKLGYILPPIFAVLVVVGVAVGVYVYRKRRNQYESV
eukprot:TRINITY_DN2051_c0_g1_i1.p1 TRINITY_DN2051_c0_g1~~TRINITY_DN2051_c0_g1_i1.p1  ORF type:complete len:320 (-),score=71.27 TRINITY_DN2051_c0_g1_i1:29-988(-)